MDPGTTVVSQAIGTSLPLPSLAVEDESFDESHPQSDSPAGEVLVPFRELIMRVREFLELLKLSSQSSTLQIGIECTFGSLLPQRWDLRVDCWYTPQGSSSELPPLN